MIYISYVVWYATMPYCQKKICAVVAPSTVCMYIISKKQLCSTNRNALRGTSAARLAEATTHTHRQHSMREALAHQQLRASTTHNSKCLHFATCTNWINYVSVQCRCNDALSLFASFAYHLWKMVVKLPYCAPSASCHHSVLYNYTHYTLNHWSSGR